MRAGARTPRLALVPRAVSPFHSRIALSKKRESGRACLPLACIVSIAAVNSCTTRFARNGYAQNLE